MHARTARTTKRLGQNFMVCREIAEIEAGFSEGRDAIEIGPGKGILTEALCRRARRVLSIEIDKRLFDALPPGHENLTLVNADFFSMDASEFSGYDILVSNIPYSMSSRVLSWLFESRIEAVLCLQKEFAERMLSKPSTRGYSRLSVFSSLFFSMERVRDVPASCFRPVPRVDSRIVRLLPRGCDASRRELDAIALLMEHKKKRVRNAIADSHDGFGIAASEARALSERISNHEERPFKLSPGELLSIARQVCQNLE